MATFWRRDLFENVSVRHGDRTLTVALRAQQSGRILHVVNVHLTGGFVSDIRLRQIAQALSDVKKNLRQTCGDASPEIAQQTPVIVCGDFNSDPTTAPHQLLTTGTFGPDDRDPHGPDQPLTKKGKKHPFKPFVNAMAEALGDTPSTLIVPERTSLLRDPVSGVITPAFDAATAAIFQHFSTDSHTLSLQDVERWTETVNFAPRRGSSYHMATALMEEHQRDTLTLDDLRTIYAKEINDGKAWSLVYDASLCGHHVEQETPTLYEESLDHIYLTPGPLELIAVREVFSSTQRDTIARDGGLPCRWYPSDHGPVGAVLRFKDVPE